VVDRRADGDPVRHRQRPVGQDGGKTCPFPRHERRRSAHMAKLRKPVLWLLLVFFIYAVVKSPDQAASIVHSAWDGIVAGARAIGRFFDALLAS
jgi:hypothetical protein